MTIKRTAVLFIIILSLLSCKTTGTFKGTTVVHGMIYDFENRPVTSYTLQIDNKKAVSDVTGRFYFEGLKAGEYVINGFAKNYETYSTQFTLSDNKQILYFRIPTLRQLFNLAQTSLTENKLSETESYIQRILISDSTNIDAQFLYAVLLVKQNEYEKSLSILFDLEKQGVFNPALFLFLADIHQYIKKDFAIAEKYLQKYISLTKDTKKIERLQELQKYVPKTDSDF